MASKDLEGIYILFAYFMYLATLAGLFNLYCLSYLFFKCNLIIKRTREHGSLTGHKHTASSMGPVLVGLTHPIRCIFNILSTWLIFRNVKISSYFRRLQDIQEDFGRKNEASVNSSKEEEKATIIKATSEFIVILCIMLEYFWSNFVDLVYKSAHFLKTSFVPKVLYIRGRPS